jgi:hypothetical protein
LGAIMNTSRSARGSIRLKWMLSPCAKASAAPSRMWSLRCPSHRSAWISSGASTITTSAHFAASAGALTVKPAPSAFLALPEPGRSATITSATPESRRFMAWAWPWLP